MVKVTRHRTLNEIKSGLLKQNWIFLLSPQLLILSMWDNVVLSLIINRQSPNHVGTSRLDVFPRHQIIIITTYLISGIVISIFYLQILSTKNIATIKLMINIQITIKFTPPFTHTTCSNHAVHTHNSAIRIFQDWFTQYFEEIYFWEKFNLQIG